MHVKRGISKTPGTHMAAGHRPDIYFPHSNKPYLVNFGIKHSRELCSTEHTNKKRTWIKVNTLQMKQLMGTAT